MANKLNIRQRNDATTQCHMLHLKQTDLLSQLLPNTQAMQSLRSLSIGRISQAALEEIFANCSQLESLLLCDRMGSGVLYDIRSIGLCCMLKVLMLPLNVGTPLAICSLANLTHLTLQRQELSQGTDWMRTVRAIIHAKRFNLQALSFDGSWLTAPLNLSHLQLAQCTALTDLRLSNCNLGENSPLLPLSCQRISFRRCSMGMPLGYKGTHPLLKKLELFDCRILSEVPILRHILNVRRHQPVDGPLLFTFSQSTRLRYEFTKWSHEDVRVHSEWLLVKELEPHQADTWRLQVGTVSMKFAHSINDVPSLQLPEESIPSAADVVRMLGSL
ncbi:uncharacterized protein LOC6552375 [Drosophila erecta]|uniref:GG12627 n=1 Tax=Drosophila erecta TaxID=7220 RepID=B3P294_DROER|nr:uncharacterized protein LOC6552375 [Drosophila erecta]EDV47844.1 uncharacterized protein Dere_GG12627 [Drosophila erecta]